MIRNVSHHRLLSSALAVLALLAVAGIACAEKSWQTTTTGPLEFGKRIYFRTDTSSTEAPNAIEAQWVTFSKQDGHIHANLRMRILSWPKSTWRVTVSLLDSKDQALESAHAVLENSGTIRGVAAISTGDLRLDLKAPKSPAVKYQIRIELVPEGTPVTAELRSAERKTGESVEGRMRFDKPIPISLSIGAGDDPKVVQLSSILFHKKESEITADLAMTIKSWPKGKWQAAVLLLDRLGRVVTVNEVVFENSGVVRGVGSIGKADLRVTLIGPRVPAESFRIEVMPVAEDTPITANLDQANGKPDRP